ncbi:hypothetical protein Q8G48_28300, partial [Klebsiella pneumoniae]|uniref:hypothetical protein n=1 Tax=Klebsiella pneumoniae TaxID=573 RepID=UPI0030136223
VYQSHAPGEAGGIGLGVSGRTPKALKGTLPIAADEARLTCKLIDVRVAQVRRQKVGRTDNTVDVSAREDGGAVLPEHPGNRAPVTLGLERG